MSRPLGDLLPCCVPRAEHWLTLLPPFSMCVYCFGVPPGQLPIVYSTAQPCWASLCREQSIAVLHVVWFCTCPLSSNAADVVCKRKPPPKKKKKKKKNDGWSCGLWSLYTVMLTGRYVLEAQRADVCLDQYIFMALANEGLHDKTTGDRFLHVYFRHLKDAVANEQPVYAFDFNPHQHLPRLQMIADKAHVNGKRDEKHEGGRTYAEATKCALPECTVTQDVVGSHLNPFLSAGGQQHQDQRDSAGRRRRRRRLR